MPCQAETPPRRPAIAVVQSLLERYGLLLALLLLGIALTIATPKFLTTSNLLNVAKQTSINGVLALGVTVVLLTGGVDLSLGSVVALAGVVVALCTRGGSDPVVGPVLAGIGVGMACGAMNGIAITFGRVAPFIVTLGMMTAVRGVAEVVSEGKTIVINSESSLLLLDGKLLGLPIPVIVVAVVSLGAWLFLGNMRLGRYIYAVGGNEQAARAAGISIGSVKIFAYTLCGAFAGLAGVLLDANTTTGQSIAGEGYELDAIAAAVIGGTSLSGGVGTIGGTLLGALLLGVVGNGLDLVNVPSYYQHIVKGIIIIGAVWLDRREK